MTLERLTKILDAYGADPARWPAAERTGALALVARSDEARGRMADAARLDDVLDRLPTAPAPSPELCARLASGASARPVRRRVAVVLAPLAAAAAALALWLVRAPDPAPTVHVSVPMATLGVYQTPTDSLLSLDEIDVAGAETPVTSDTFGRMHA